MLIGIILIVIAVAELCLGVFFLNRYQKNQATMWYGLFAISVAKYVGANGLGYTGWIDGQLAEHLAWIGGMSTAFFFLPFSYSYPLPLRPVRELWTLALWPLVIFFPGLLWTGAFIGQRGIVKFGEGYTTDMGPYFWFMIFVFGTYWLWAIWNLSKRLGSTDGIHRRNIQLILGGIITSLIVSAVFDIYFPLADITRYGFLGSLFTSVWFGFTSYILVRK